MTPYIHELPDWPAFRCDSDALAAPLAAVRHRQGRLLGRLKSLGFAFRRETQLESLTLDVLKSSEIEGELLNPQQVRSSIARRLGTDAGSAVPTDRRVEGVVEMALDATLGYDRPLGAERLFGWHGALFPTGRNGIRPIIIGAWRDDARGPMQVVSGPAGWEVVHFEAPAALRLEAEMSRFFSFANDEHDGIDPVLKAALAHLWFVTIHPFDDGNGRVARAVAEWQLARADGCPQRFYSMSAQIRIEREAYYQMLEQTQRSTLDITPWISWFLGCLDRAFGRTESTISAVIRKARRWESVAHVQTNGRQRDMVNRLIEGFAGRLTTKKWAALQGCSHDTELRDIQGLIERGVLVKEDAGAPATRSETHSASRSIARP